MKKITLVLASVALAVLGVGSTPRQKPVAVSLGEKETCRQSGEKETCRKERDL